MVMTQGKGAMELQWFGHLPRAPATTKSIGRGADTTGDVTGLPLVGRELADSRVRTS